MTFEVDVKIGGKVIAKYKVSAGSHSEAEKKVMKYNIPNGATLIARNIR